MMELDVMRKGGGIHVELVPGTFRPTINKYNDYMIDRDAQKAGRTYSGVTGIAMQDASIQESMGPIADRTKENLVSTDNAIIMARHRLRRAALALQQGTAPPGLKQECHRARAAPFRGIRMGIVLVPPGRPTMKLPRRQFLVLTAGAAAFPAMSRIAKAQTYPTHPVTLIVPYPAGGGVDAMA
jgi:LigXa C-terminal domain like